MARLGMFAAYAVFYALTEPAEKTLVANLVGQGTAGWPMAGTTVRWALPRCRRV